MKTHIDSRKGEYMHTHIITLTKDKFDKIEIGDRLLIKNDENCFAFEVFVEDSDKSEE